MTAIPHCAERGVREKGKRETETENSEIRVEGGIEQLQSMVKHESNGEKKTTPRSTEFAETLCKGRHPR